MFEYDMCVFIGRFRVFHLGHLSVIKAALKRAKYITIIVGSYNEPRSYRNPFTHDEVVDMIVNALTEDEFGRVTIRGQEDHPYNDTHWVEGIQESVFSALDEREITRSTASVALIGFQKDHSSYYLSMFPQWDSISVAGYMGISATPIRVKLFTVTDRNEFADAVDSLVPRNVLNFLLDFRQHADYADICAEYEHVRKYREAWQAAPYEPTFVTVDACVVQAGHVLLVKRKGFPGRGLWALPGGFINTYEKIEDAVIRELKEETRIKVPAPVLRGSIRANQVFDHPYRSSRGRTITHAYLIHLTPSPMGDPKRNLALPEIKASSDAKKAVWVPLADIDRKLMFEDHASIIDTLIAKL